MIHFRPKVGGLQKPRVLFRHLPSGRLLDSIWSELRDGGIWKKADFEIHEANTLAGAGDRTEWRSIFADWFPIADGQTWCPENHQAIEAVHVPSTSEPARLADFLEAARAFFTRFEGRKIGVQLSGGFDSSLIIGLLRHFGIRHGLVGMISDRYEFRTERCIQEYLASQNCEVELIYEHTCLPCSRLDDVPPHQHPDLLSLDYAQDRDMAMACKRLGVEVLISGGGGDNLFGQEVPSDAHACIWRPQTFTDLFPVDLAYQPLGIEFLSFFSDAGIVDVLYRLRRGQADDFRKLWARQFFQQFVPRELVDYHYCADFWGRSIDGLSLALDEIRRLHREALSHTGNPYFAEHRLELLIAEDIYRPRKELYQRIEARCSSAVWVCSLAKWLDMPDTSLVYSKASANPKHKTATPALR
jgi:hypothetical protein